VELYLHSSNTLSWRGAQLKDRDNFTSALRKRVQVIFLGSNSELVDLMAEFLRGIKSQTHCLVISPPLTNKR
jgi:hypothetical protein